MNEWIAFLGRTVFIGIGATLLMDLWGIILKQFFGIKSLDFGMLGRWVGHLFHGQFFHKNITTTTAIKGEKIIGWTIHYFIGITFAALLILLWGIEWTKHPVILPAIFIGIVTVVAPFFILQPGMGLGIAASKTPNPNKARLKSLLTHFIYGIGLYLSALLLNTFTTA
ncbi:MAG: DUF2938 domain-containing protein [Chitinophagaceae bacterium]|jgi:hypothetical protein|nr:DUF2938 domain-containing protein [Chitinophagaceae bacterium]MBK9661264.1 DUF2938 domain-containing protein [Chitinophagaceae bacterium]MBP6231885.1 DUF2938 domain-containing protein [Chitinophagaceae bacterium]MBP6416731.1 DUF2938 domain-containing protein [Chitinophagaceae bacterium]HQW45396.1 DUF2938 domain-containing protein [Chitinophagaceae bacterium]